MSASTDATDRGASAAAFHNLSIDEVQRRFEVDPRRGLSEDDVRRLHEQHGYNELTEAPPEPTWRKLASQFKELVIWILIVAAVISGVMGEWVDTLAILAIVLVNGVIGFLQEERAARALAALRSMSAPAAKVRRGGEVLSLPSREIVPGDVLLFEAGDHVAADARLIEAFSLRAQEAALTGESTPVEKEAGEALAADAPLGDRRNMVHQGTVISAGKATAVVAAVGMQTELGRIAGMLDRAEHEPTPLQRRLAELGRVLVVVCLVLVAVIFGLQMLRGGDVLELFLAAVSLAVAAVPEGLPAVVTIALAIGLQRMVARNALVRKLPSVETLGSVTVICSDKTGTLTRNEMTVREMITAGGRYQVTGGGYAPEGEFLDDQERPVAVRAESDLAQALAVAAHCNNAALRAPEEEHPAWRVIGDPTEGALLVAARKGGIDPERDRPHVLSELPFDSDRKAMSVVVRNEDGAPLMYTKGAPEMILGRCATELHDGQTRPLTDERRQAIERANAEMAGRALRVLALAFRLHPIVEDDKHQETELVLAALVGMIDPPRDEARAAVADCHAAGIRPVMITGDHPATALAIARELGIADADDEAVSGQELDQLSDEALAERVERISVYARVSAEHKLRVVRAWRARGQVVAMTGDGVNDAPAVQAADIGIAMGVTGTDVTKEASDMVLTDDNFASIVAAVEEGRGIFDNIQKSLHYLLAGSVGEVLFVLSTVLLGWPFPLAAIQILWINLVTNGLPALGLAMEPPERGLMSRPPRPPREPVLTWRNGLVLLTHGVLFAGASAAAFWIVYQGRSENVPAARTAAFCVLALAEVCYAFACRSPRRAMPELGFFTNPHLLAAIALSTLLQLGVITLPFARHIFDVPATYDVPWLLLVPLALAPVTLIELWKLARAYVLPRADAR